MSAAQLACDDGPGNPPVAGDCATSYVISEPNCVYTTVPLTYELVITADADAQMGLEVDDAGTAVGGSGVVIIPPGGTHMYTFNSGDVYDITITNLNFLQTPCTPVETDIHYCCVAEAGFVVTSPICPEDDLEISIGQVQVFNLYTTDLLITDAAGVILDILPATPTSSPTMPTIGGATVAPIPYTYWAGLLGTGQTYYFYSYNELTVKQPVPDAAIGVNVADIGTGGAAGDDVCFDLSAVEDFFVPDPFPVIGMGPNADEGVTGGTGPFGYNVHEFGITGGTPPYSYEWDETGYVRHAVTGEGEVRVLYADDAEWSVTITDANGCSSETLVASNDGDSGSGVDFIVDIESYDITGDNPFTPAGEGEISIVVTGGDCGGAYTYDWSGPGGYTSSGSPTISDLHGGWYSVVVTCGDQTTEGWYWVPNEIPGTRSKTMETALSASPNPFQTETNISFSLGTDSDAQLAIYNVSGQKVADLFNGAMEAGVAYQTNFNAGPLANGIYFVKLTSAEGEQIEKLVLTK